ncbi:MAG TPA: dienelactone hydrolase family protein [Gemmataceae bacterium]|nr:dienelactone hydrolase family protein [Gemmataceae bacterium]
MATRIFLLATIFAVPGFVSAQDKKVPTPYATAPDKALEPKEELVKDFDEFSQFRVEFNGIKDDRVPAYVYVPKRDVKKNPVPAILLQYGAGGNKKTDYIVAIGKQFAGKGYLVITIDSPNQGERRAKDQKSDILGMASSERVMHYCGDYSRAVDYLCTRADVDKNRIGYVGISWGAITGITFCAYEPRIKAVGSMVGGGNFFGLYSPKSAAKAGDKGSKSSDPVVHVARIAPRPLLFINVKKDQLILKSWAESLHECAGPGAKVVWLDTDHYFSGLDRAAICLDVIRFMDEELVGEKTKK